MDNFATHCASEMIKAPCNARKSSRYCNWITLTQVNEVFFCYDEHYFNNYYHNYLKRDARACTHEDVDYYFQ